MTSADTPRLQPLLIRAVVEALFSIFCDNRHADKVIEQVLRNNKKAGSRDRAFIAESTYEIVRYYRLYTEILGRTPESQWDFWQLSGIHLAITTKSDLPKMLEFNDLNTPAILAQHAQLCTQRAFRESIPDWLDAVGLEELPDVWDDTLAALNKQAKVVLRANSLRATREALQRALFEDNIESVAVGSGEALVLKRRQNIFQHKTFREGWFEVQDFSSQLVAHFLAPAPGMRIVDACAGGGGKTLHISALMQNKGSIIALDTYAWKLDALRLRARRAGASNIEVRTIENSKTIKRLHHTADRLLLDVPCSGLGVLRRNPDSKWKLSMDRLEQLRATQKELLRAYSPMVKPGGQMVYATCSILPSENQDQVQDFLSSDAGKAFKLLDEKRILPQEEGFDGFYMALMARDLQESSPE
jgi:16S rRNA (cytosine967-C5)-methyltransferase